MRSVDPDAPLNAKQMTINTAGLLLLFGWACYVLLAWLASHYLQDARVSAAALIGSAYLLAVGGLLAYMATLGLKSGRHLTYRSAIVRTSSPIAYWLLTLAMGGIGTALIGAGAFALLRIALYIAF
jgi:hypothetical protein